MKVTLEPQHAASFRRAVSAALTAAPRRAVVLATSGVLLEAEDGTLRASCTSLDLYARGASAATIDAPGRALVDAARFAAVVAAQPEDAALSLRLVDDGRRLEVAAGRSRARFATIAADDFPAPPSFEDAVVVEASCPALVSALDVVRRMQCTDTTRYNLNGVRWDDGLAVATDGHRLGIARSGLLLDGVTWPSGLVAAVVRALGSVDGSVAIGRTDSWACVDAPDFHLAGRLVDGSFPDWRQVVPKKKPARLLCDRTQLVGAIERITAGVTGSAAVRLAADKGEPTMRIDHHAVDLDTHEHIALDDEAPAAVEWAADARYLLDALRTLLGSHVAMHLDSGLAPGLFRDDANDVRQHVIMPVRI